MISVRAIIMCSAILVTFGTSVLLAQHALDHNLRQGSGGYNARVPSGLSLARPVFTVNRATGGFQYNRANAFKDPAYNIYQRYTHDRKAYFDPTPRRASEASGVVSTRPPAPPKTLGRSLYSVRPAAPQPRAATDRARGLRRAPSRVGGPGTSRTASMMREPRYASLPTYNR